MGVSPFTLISNALICLYLLSWRAGRLASQTADITDSDLAEMMKLENGQIYDACEVSKGNLSQRRGHPIWL